MSSILFIVFKALIFELIFPSDNFCDSSIPKKDFVFSIMNLIIFFTRLISLNYYLIHLIAFFIEKANLIYITQTNDI